MEELSIPETFNVATAYVDANVEAGAAQACVQLPLQLVQRLRHPAGRQVQHAAAPAAEVIQAQLAAFARQLRGEAQQRRQAAGRLCTEKGQGQVQVGGIDRPAAGRFALTPGADRRGQRRRAGQGEEQA